MRKVVQVILFFIAVFSINAQELNCVININSNKISGSNKQVYKTLQTALNEFVNQTKWTNKNFKLQEKIDCAFTIIINSQPNTNTFNASIQVQATRPVYGTSYSSTILNIKDDYFGFKYTEFEPLNYNTTSFESNLISTIVYYIYVILGVDSDTFALNSGTSYYKQAEDIVLLSQQSGGNGWENKTGKQNRYSLINNLISSKSEEFRNVLYSYHREGMDVFSKDKSKAKEVIEDALIKMENIHNKMTGNHLIRMFFDSKSDEIATIFSDGPSTPKSKKLQEVLQRISPTNNSKWLGVK